MVLLNRAQMKRLNMLCDKAVRYELSTNKMTKMTLGNEILIHAQQLADTVTFGKERRR